MYKYILETQPMFSFYEYSHSTHICVLILAETSDIIPFSMSHLFTIILVCVILHAHLSYLSHKCGEYPIISFIQWFYRLASGRTVISTINYIRSNLFMCSKVDCRNSLVIQLDGCPSLFIKYPVNLRLRNFEQLQFSDV